MIKIGDYNTLRVVKSVDFGLYLEGDDGQEILLPSRYVPDGVQPDDMLRVFIYNDSEDRLIATTETPYVRVGEFAYLQVSQVNDTGVFIDWGLSKDLLLPFSQQKMQMRRGGIYLVYVYLDDASHRVVASAKVDRFLGNVLPDYAPGQEVECLVTGATEIGYSVIVENRHRGMIYRNETFRNIEVEETLRAHVLRIRPDGKIDLRLGGQAHDRVASLSDSIMATLRAAGGHIALCDNSSPDDIRAMFACSKKDFKKALGTLYRERRINILDDGIELATR